MVLDLPAICKCTEEVALGTLWRRRSEITTSVIQSDNPGHHPSLSFFLHACVRSNSGAAADVQ